MGSSTPRSPAGDGAGPDVAPAPSPERIATSWRRVSDYCITNGTQNICRVVVNGEEVFEVWDATTKQCLARKLKTADDARAFCAGQPRKGGRDFGKLREVLG